MNRQNLNSYAKRAVVPMFVLFTAAASFGAVLFEDDFTSQNNSNSKWFNSLDDAMTVNVSGGSCNLSNTTVYGGEYYHPFNTKPSTFTISFVLKSVSSDGDAGVLFCRSEGFNGYYLTLKGGRVALYKNANGSGNTIYYENSVDINASDNKLTVSKQGSEIHLFVNDIFQGKVSDATYASGDVSLLVYQNTSAVFGAFHMTDVFTEGQPRTNFADNFDNGRSKYWNFLSNGGTPDTASVNGAFKVATGANVNSWIYVDVLAADFTARVDVKYVTGNTTTSSIYGIVLLGDAPAGANIPMLYFGISGNRRYAVGTPNNTNGPDLAIRGSAVKPYIDTLEVSKKYGSSAYEFKVNGETLSDDYPVANFAITGIGVFTYPDITIEYDNFEVKKDNGNVSIKSDRNPQTVRGGKKAAAKDVNTVFYDLRGRKRYVANPQAAGRVPLRAAGVYVSRDGRKVLTDRDKRAK